MKNNAKTIKMLILAEATRVMELLNKIPEENLKNMYEYSSDVARNKAELKAKMAELRRDTMAMENIIYTWVSK
jgi:cell division protein FtsB